MILDKIKKRENENPEDVKSKVDIPVGKWIKCNSCGDILYKETVHDNFSICLSCGNYFRLSSRRRLKQIIDEGTYEEFDLNIETINPLGLEDYPKKLHALKEKTLMDEGVRCGVGKINGLKTVICVMDCNFLMGSMGSVVGEKITYSIEKAIELKLPIIIFSVSGGARMQEGIYSLMQMAKTSCAVAKLNKAKLLYITVLTEPTFGGVTASFGTLGDIIIAERGARMGFAGRRVIEQTIRQKLPADFQTAEYFMKHGQVDMICDRGELKSTIVSLIKLHLKK